MAFLTRWRRRYTAISILTANLAFAPAALSQSCESGPSGVEHAMQDGLSHLSQAEALYQETLRESDDDPNADTRACGFLRGSVEYYTEARDRFSACVALVDEALADCPDASWDGISANPALCDTRITEIDTKLAAISDEIAEHCEDE